MDPRHARASGPRIPLATYRLQLHGAFTFDHARALVPYLAALGVSDLYASSYLTARPGSLHGYDVVDHNALNPEIGTPASHQRLVEALQTHGLGQILDIVPNHMGIAEAANRWWNDLLENGPSSPYADYFDVDWEPVKRELLNKVLLPVLGDQYGRVLENQELQLAFRDGALVVVCYQTPLPMEPRSTVRVLSRRLEALTAELGEDDAHLQEYQSILTALQNLPPYTERAPERVRERSREKEVIRRRLASLAEASEPIRLAIEDAVREFNGKRGDPRSFDLLDQLLGEQVYRLAHWRVAAEEINYRRFFDVNELAAIRVEEPSVFRDTHRLILQLVEAGQVTGLRVDHPDGLFDPPGYFLALQRETFARAAGHSADAGHTEVEMAAQVADAAARFEADCGPDPRRPGCRPLYVVAEKILATGERLPAGWAIQGTTGYELLNLVGGLFVESRHERLMTGTHAAFTGERRAYADIVYEAKQLIMQVAMSSELNVLGHALNRLSERDRYSRDFTLNSLTDALKEVIACFPVYRTYVDGREPQVSLQDRACIEVAVAFAKRRNPARSASVFDFVRDVLLLRYPEHADEAYRQAQLAFVRKFQQVTAPVTAKGVEDTAFYRFYRLASLNEVGGDPTRFGVSVAEFHAAARARQEAWPHGLSATATHDTKRGEDLRSRIHVLSEIPREWRAAVGRWHRWNRSHRTRLDGTPAPDPRDEYLLYQTLVGVWPPGGGTGAGGGLTARLQEYMRKAAREAKLRTSWVSPHGPYEAALDLFVERILEAGAGNRFLEDLVGFQAPVARQGVVNSLAQVLLKVTLPGVPDFYQGTELWDLSLVDPDNRRPVDFAERQTLLAELAARLAVGDQALLAGELLREWTDGRVKLYTIYRALACRRAAGATFQQGDYTPLTALGPAADHVCAFARQEGGRAILTVVPRLTARLTRAGAGPDHGWPVGRATWGDTRIALPEGAPPGPYRNWLTGQTWEPSRTAEGSLLPVGDLLGVLPVALLDSAAAVDRSTDTTEPRKGGWPA